MSEQLPEHKNVPRLDDPDGWERETTNAPSRGTDRESNTGAVPVLSRPCVVGKLLAGIIGGIVIGVTLAYFSIYNLVPNPEHGTANVLKRFNLRHTPSILAIHSSAVMMAAAGVFWFLRTPDPPCVNQRKRSCSILSMVLIVLAAGAIGMATVAGMSIGAVDNEAAALPSVSHILVQAVEDGLEMVGVALFLCFLFDYLNLSGLTLWVKQVTSFAEEEIRAN